MVPRMTVALAASHYPGITPQIVRRPDGGLALHVLNQQVEGMTVLGIGKNEEGKVVASIVLDVSKAVFGEADGTVHRAPNLRV
jgi:hypothetical protein